MDRSQEGFTLVEVLIVVSVLLVIIVGSIFLGGSQFAKRQIDGEAEEMLSVLRRAQARSVSGYVSDVWGVHIQTSEYTLFLGSDWPARDTTYDEVHVLPASMTALGISEVHFIIGTGETPDYGTITLTQDSESSTITVSESGLITMP